MPEKLKHTPGEWRTGMNYPCRIMTTGRNIAQTCAPVDEGSEQELEIANAALIALAPAAPHHCADPACPGDVNRRKLEAFEQIREALSYALRYGPECAIDNPLHGRVRDKALAALALADTITEGGDVPN